MKIPREVKNALQILAGYCDKHKRCEGCPLDRFCENGKYLAMCDWDGWEEDT